MITVKELKAWLNQTRHWDEDCVAIVRDKYDCLMLELKAEKDAHNQAEPCDELEVGGWPDPPEENPREKGDDDGVEYADPRDFMDGIE